MSAEHEVRARGGSRALTEHVAGSVNPHIGEAERLEHRFQGSGAPLFLERRGFDFAEPDLLLDYLGLVTPHCVQGPLHGRVRDQARAYRVSLVLYECRGDAGLHTRDYQNKENALKQFHRFLSRLKVITARPSNGSDPICWCLEFKHPAENWGRSRQTFAGHSFVARRADCGQPRNP
jgi:hypothetical protein